MAIMRLQVTLHVGQVKWNYGTVLHGRAFASRRRELGQFFFSPTVQLDTASTYRVQRNSV